MILITSASFVDQDFAGEFGLLPPAFLPLGNLRLFQLQADLLSSLKGDRYISLPRSFGIDEYDLSLLQDLHFQIIQVPENISLGQSILYSWNSTGKSYQSFHVLHGDTLFQDWLPPAGDCFSCHENRGLYERASTRISETGHIELVDTFARENQQVISGYFSFNKPHLLMKSLIENNLKFTPAIQQYANTTDVSMEDGGVWLDFGHVNSYFHSRTVVTTQRAFNSLDICSHVLTKRSKNADKLKAEANWYESLPMNLRHHAPQYLGQNSADSTCTDYALEYLHLVPLSDIFVFGRLPVTSWRKIFFGASEILQDFQKSGERSNVDIGVFEKMYLGKTIKRLNSIKNTLAGFDLDTELINTGKREGKISITEMARIASKNIPAASPHHAAVSHGDFCLSNMLYDARASKIKLIDPRGLDANNHQTILGDIRYDIAKLYHSIVGKYDFIIAGRFHLVAGNDGFPDIYFEEQEELRELANAFRDVFFNDGRISETEIAAINVHLFLSMIPLHYDEPERQLAMLSNAVRMFMLMLDFKAETG